MVVGVCYSDQPKKKNQAKGMERWKCKSCGFFVNRPRLSNPESDYTTYAHYPAYLKEINNDDAHCLGKLYRAKKGK